MLVFILSACQAALFGALYYAACVVLTRRTGQALLSCAVAFAPMVVTAMVTFWATWLDRHSAAVINTGTWLTLIPAAWVCLRLPFHRDAAIAAVLWVVASITLMLWAFGPTGAEMMTEVARSRFHPIMTGDNTIPLDFARALLSGHVPSPLHGDWLSSDRPPLQTGIFLAFRVPAVPTDAAYQVLATTVQMAIVPAMYVLGRAAGLSRNLGIALAVVIFFSPVTIINGSFVWPKLITAALLAAAAAIHFTTVYEGAKRTILAGAAVGTLSAGAMLAHGAAGFTIVAFIIVAAFSRRWASPKYVVAAFASIAMLYGSWIGYQRLVDPPGDRLLKWQFADVIDHNDRRSVFQSVQDAYAGMTLSDHASRTVQKVKNTFDNPFIAVSGQPSETVRSAMFFNILPASGIAGIVGVMSLIGLFLGQNRLLISIFLINYAVWVLLIFNVSGVVVHQSSMFMLLLLPLIAVIALKRFPPAVYMMASAHAALTIFHLGA